jgi:DNA-binding IclR family transcriptional regulator
MGNSVAKKATARRTYGTRPAGGDARGRTLRHAASILRVFSPAEPVLGVNEIARRVGLDRSTVSRLLHAMAGLGFVTVDAATQRFRLGMGLVELAGTALAGLNLRDAALPHLRRLSVTTRETINLAVLDGDEAVTIEHVPGLEPIKALGWVGRRYPSYCTSIGKVLLAFADEATRAGVLARPLVAYTATTIVDPARLCEELEMIRRRGYGLNRAEFQDGLSAVAAPIRDHRGVVQASLGLAGPAYRLTEERLHELSVPVMEVAAAISRDLGATTTARVKSP